jgi:hypothetical protein
MSDKSVTYVNIEPTWREILPALLALLEMPQTRQTALDELTRMARLADAQVAHIKSEDK